MKTRKAIIITILVFIAQTLCAQQNNYKSLLGKDKTKTATTDLVFYGGLQHQHQDFFNKAFSFQGAEAGILLKNSIMLGIYGSTFVSNLEVEIADNPMYMLINQVGFSGGMVRNNSRLLHTGFLLSAGFFSLSGDSNKLPLFRTADHEIAINGLVLSPQLFTELNLSSWMKFRTGLAYNFYNFGNNTMIAKSDLENFSINFGFLFGKFSRV
jgi:hypothetical protein